MKITHHTVLAVACTLLMLVTVAPVAASDGQRLRAAGTPHAPAGNSTAATVIRLAQNSPPDTSRGKQGKRRDKERNNDTRTPDAADNGSSLPSVSRSEAAAIAERATGGRVLSVREDGRYWQVKVLVDEQRVRFVNVDKYSGRVR